MRARRTATAWPSPRWHRWKLTVLLGVILLLKPVGGVWELEQLWVEDIREYVEKYTGDLDEKGTAIDSKFLRFEQTGWYQKLYDRTSVGMDKGKADIDTGLIYNTEFPGLGTKPEQLYSNSLRRCGPNLERTPQRELGCTNDLPVGSPYGPFGAPGAGPQQWAYRGSSLGPPDEPLGGDGCNYKLSYEENLLNGYECYRMPPLGGVRVPEVANEPLNLGFSTLATRLPPAQWRDRLEPYYQKWYDSAPLQWGFEEGTFFPYWELRSVGMPNFVVKKHCYLDAHAGQYQLCSAYPWDKRNITHGLLHVRSVPFVLGMGDLTFEANGGDATVPDMPMSTFPIASNGEGILGVSLTRLSDGSRLRVKPVRARRYWETLGWTAQELESMRGEKFTLDIYDYRANDWGWLAVDTFVVPAAWIQIESVTPIGGPRSGGTLIDIVGKNFGNSADGIVVFIGDKECTSLGMTNTGSLSCITPPGDGAGVTVSVVIGDYDRTLQQGPFGGHQAGHCGDESVEYPFSPCKLGEASLEAGVPKRGFTYLDAPYWISTPVTLAQEDSQYLYKAAAADDDVGDELFFVAEQLPSFMRFDPATQVISGTPLRSDVNCRSSKWHPAIDRCREGGFHKVVLMVSDYTFQVRQEFIVHVLPNPSPLLAIDRSFHWPTQREIAIMRNSAQLAKYHLKASSALAARALSPTGATVLPWTGRNPASDALRTLLSNLLQETRVHGAEAKILIDAVRASGLAAEHADLIAAVESSIRAQDMRVARNRASQPAVLGGDQEGWMEQLEAFLGASVRGTEVRWEPAGGGGPWTSWSLHQDQPRLLSGGERYGGFFPTPSGPGLALSTRRINDVELIISIPTRCYSGVPRHPRIVSCDFTGYEEVHTIQLRLAPGGLRVAEAVLEPPDFPHVDLVSHALESQDLFGLVEAISRRAASYAKRYEEYDTLPARYEPLWQPSSSSLTIITNVATNLLVSIDIPHDYPWPAAGELKPAPIRVLAADGIPYHRREGLAAMSAEIEADAAKAGGDNQGGLAAQLVELERKLSVYAHRCRNDCEGNGDCDTTVFPPVCRCHEGYSNDDCSWLGCPNDCSGRGACDEKQMCHHDEETGETDCEGGTGKCSCVEPFFGADCSLQPCQKNYLVNEQNIDVTLGEDHFRSLYESMGWKVSKIRLSATNGDPPPKGSIPGDPFSIAASAKGVAYIVFASSDDAMEARAMDPFYRDATPSRGIASRARNFPDELRRLEQRERHLLALFGEAQVECTGHGACDYGAGECYCAKRYFGAACEYTYCPKDCAGHGRCDFVTGTCECEENYVSDQFEGCKLRQLYLASTTCEDAAMDKRVDATGRRVSPLHLSCMLGTPLGSKALAEHCPEANALTGEKGDCYTKFPPYASESAAAAAASSSSSSSAVTVPGICADCSGYDAHNISQIHLYVEEPCRSIYGSRFFECVDGRTASDVVRGLGMLPSGDVDKPTQITFNLTTMRRKDMVFTRFRARPGIVRRLYHSVEDGGCGACTDESPMCGASFEVLRDDQVVYSAVVAANSTVEVDVRGASTLTLRTGTVSPTYWRLGGGLSYGGGLPPAIATEPVKANFCDGAAWADAMLV